MAKGRKLEKYISVDSVADHFVVNLRHKDKTVVVAPNADSSVFSVRGDALIFATEVATTLKLKVVGV